ncbi:MAG: hypothetical protein GY810_18170 [Aureispira sp.]|nr:hypothetical protein [Aureispira sp.]
MKNLIGIILVLITFWACETEPSDTNEIPKEYSKAGYTEAMHKVFGGAGNNDDELVSGAVVDDSGNVYFSLNTNKDVIIGKIDAGGSLGWSKKWDGTYDDESPDSGGNAETGGTANSISMDASGNIYAVLSSSDVSQNNIYSAIILKINPSDGSTAWAKQWKPEWPTGSVIARMDARASGVDATGDYVYVTGSTANGDVVLLAINKGDGSIFYQRTLDIVPGTADKGHVLRKDNNGNLFICAISGSSAHLVKISSANTANPAVAWVKKVDMGVGSKFNSIDIDNNELYLSCDIRGVTTYFNVLKLSNDGAIQWGKTYPGNDNDRNNTHVVKVVGSSVYIGGRTAQKGLDNQMGDGLLVKLDKSTGALQWHGYLFSGLEDGQSAEHRIKGIHAKGSNVYIVGQVYTGNANSGHFTGDWVTKEATLQDYAPTFTDVTALNLSTPSTGEIRDATGTYTDAGSNYVLQDAVSKTQTSAPDGDLFYVKMSLN